MLALRVNNFPKAINSLSRLLEILHNDASCDFLPVFAAQMLGYSTQTPKEWYIAMIQLAPYRVRKLFGLPDLPEIRRTSISLHELILSRGRIIEDKFYPPCTVIYFLEVSTGEEEFYTRVEARSRKGALRATRARKDLIAPTLDELKKKEEYWLKKKKEAIPKHILPAFRKIGKICSDYDISLKDVGANGSSVRTGRFFIYIEGHFISDIDIVVSYRSSDTAVLQELKREFDRLTLETGIPINLTFTRRPLQYPIIRLEDILTGKVQLIP